MKASELIKRLQELIDEYGDLDVEVIAPDYLSSSLTQFVQSIEAKGRSIVIT